MKKLLILFIAITAAFSNVNAQKLCCPIFKLTGGTEECRPPYSPGGGGTQGGPAKDSCDIKACKNITQPYVVFPNEPGFTYTWVVTGGTASTLTGNPMNITWDNGSTGSVIIIISNATGTCRDTIKKNVCILDAPVASFTVNPASPVCNNASVQFNNTSAGANVYSWDFGDGNFSADVNPVHTFPGPGSYNVILSVSNGTTGSGPVQEKECGCKDTASMTIVVKAESGINIISGCKKMLCKGDTASYCTTAACNSFNWSVTGGHIIGSANGRCINVVWDGSYPATVNLTGSCGGACGNTASLAVPVLYPVMSVSGSSIVCPGSSNAYSLPSMPGTFYGWHLSGGGNISGADSNVNLIHINWSSTPGTYYITCYYNNPNTGCSGIAKDTVQILPKYKITGLTKYCVGDNFNFNANGAGTWSINPSSGFTPASFTAGTSITGVWNVPGTYIISATPVTTANFCAYPATIAVTVFDKPKLNAIVGPILICKGSTQVYAVSSNINDGLFNWIATGGSIATQMGSHQDSVAISWGNSGVYSLSVTQIVNGCSSLPKQIIIDTFPKPIITGNTSACAGQTTTYTVTGVAPPGGWVWGIGSGSAGTIVSQTSNTVNILWNGNVLPGPHPASVNITLCGVVTAYPVTITTPPNITVTKSGNLCNPGVTLSAGLLPCYQWYRNGVLLTGAATSSYLATLPGYYEVRCPNQCSGYGGIAVPAEFNATPVTITADNFIDYCSTDSINLNLNTISIPSAGCTFQWYKNGTAIFGQTGNTLNLTTQGSYFVVNTCGNCKDTSNIIVVTQRVCGPGCKVNLPMYHIGEDLAKNGPAYYSENTTVPILVTTGIIIGPPSKLCNNPAFFATYTIDPPKIFNSGIDWNYGDGYSYSSTANSAYTPVHHYNAAGVYIVTAHFSANCPIPPPAHLCDYYDTIHYTVPAAANFNYSVNCNQVTLTNLSTSLSGCSISSYNWSATGGTFANPTAANTIFTASSGTYNIRLIINTTCGCRDTITIPVNILAVNASFTPPVSGCVNEKTDFTALPGMPHYLWYFGDGNTSATQTTSHTYQTPGSFTVSLVVTDNLGCKDSTAHSIVIYPAVTVSPGADVFVCPGSFATLTATGTNISTYQWYKNGVLISGATNAVYNNADYGTYYVIATSINGCTKKSGPVNVYYKAAPIAKIKAPGTNIICTNGGSGYISLNNTVAEPNTNYTWTGTGPGTVSFSPASGSSTYITIAGAVGTYQIILSAANTLTGCTSRDTLCLVAYSSPTVSIIGPPGILCEGNKYAFTANAAPVLGTGSYMYQWGNGTLGNTMVTGLAGPVSVTAIDPHGCSATAFSGLIKPRADVSLFPVGCDTLCLTDTVRFPLPLGGGLTPSSYTIQWYDSGTLIGTNSILLPLAAIGPGDHHFYAIVKLAGGCADTTGTFDLFVKDCTLLPPCDNCPAMYDRATFSAGSLSGNILQGSFTFTSTKPLKEVRINVADLQYWWNDPKCKNCKAAVSDRACIYPANSSQQVGGLVWDNFTGSGIPPAASGTDCPKELIFKPGVIMPPGTYSIPLQISFAPPAASNCKLIIDKLCIHLAITDENCKVCEKNVCTGNPDPPTKDSCDCSADKNWTNLFIVPAKVGVPKPKTLIFCNSSISGYSANTPYLLSGMYNCRPPCVTVKNEVVIRNQTGDIIYTHIGATLYENILFPAKGIYTVILTAYCGGKKCECKFQIVIGEPQIDTDPPIATNDPPPPDIINIEKVLTDILPPDFSGGILVAKKDRILYEKYKGNKVNDHTAFDLASVAKTFTAMAVLKMAEEKKIGLGNDVTEYLTGFPITGITVKMLLSHTSGLEDYVKFMQTAEVDKTDMLSNNDLLQYIIKNKGKVQVGKPGSAFNYSNTNFALLALIIEKLSGQTYGQYLSEKFFVPLKMGDTYVYGPSTVKTATPSYYKNGKAYDVKFLDFIYGDKNVYSTVRDMMKWDKALRDGKIFSKETMALAYTPGSTLIADQSNYGMGWRILLVPNGKKIIYHNGWWHGNRSVFIRLLDEEAVIIILSNSSFTTISDSRKLADLFGAYKQNGRNIVNF